MTLFVLDVSGTLVVPQYCIAANVPNEAAIMANMAAVTDIAIIIVG